MLIIIFWLSEKKKKTIHCIDNNKRVYTNEIKAQFYKYRWLANGIWRRFPEIIGGNKSIVVVGIVARWMVCFADDDERWCEWPFRLFCIDWDCSDDLFEFSFDGILSPGEEFVDSKFLLKTTLCCCWYRWVGGGGGAK